MKAPPSAGMIIRVPRKHSYAIRGYEAETQLLRSMKVGGS